MLKRVFSAVMFILLLTSTLTLAFNIQPVKATGTIYIRADGSIDPPTAPIQGYGDVYTLTDNVYDSLVIERDNIVVEGTGKTVQGTDEFDSRGIDLSNRVNVTVTNTRITAFYYGVYLYHSSNNRIYGNNITDNSDGVWMDDSSNNSISGNDLDGNRNVGIVLYYSSNNSVSGNSIANNAEGIWVQGSFSNSISGNNIANNVDGIGLDNSFSNSISGNNITDNNNWSMMLVSSSTNSVSGNTFTDDGLYVWDSYLNSVENNTVNGKPLVYLEGVADYSVSEAGQVILVNCDSIRVENLNLSRTIIGVQLLETNNTLVSGNNITDNHNYGIWVQGSFNNSISGNNITDNWTGIYLYTSSSNNIVGNNITDNWTGIWLGSSSNNSVSGNNITGNNHYGILTSADGNLIYHNNFIDNSQQVSVYTSGYPNVWDGGYPSGGNYWSDYTGVDVDGDGIGDTPYVIDANNQDHYPLMHPWSPLPVHNINTGLGYATIQEAINVPETLDRHTIFVEAGTYYENVIVNKAISLIGESEGTTKIIGDGSSFVIFVREVKNVVISDFTVQGSGNYPYAGIYLFRSSDNIICDNIVESNDGIGVRLNFANDNIISGNEIVGNYAPLSCEWSTNTLIESNYVIHNQVGLDLYGSNGTRVVGNNISSNGRFGIAIFGGNNLIIENTIAFNDLGIWFYGLETMTIDNRVYHNNLVGNIEHAQTRDFTAIWDDGYPSGGNCWSDYNGTDLYSGPYQNETGSDGIGDSPYVIDENNQDRYPLGVFRAPVLGDLNGDGIVNILDAIQAASAFGSYPGHPKWNEQADINRDGVVNILDVITLSNNFGQHYP